MATVSGVVYAVSILPPTPNAWLTQGYVNGREKVNLDFYVATGAEAAGTVILMGALLPIGAKILSIALSASASTGGLTVSVGDLDNATRYGTALTGIATAGITSVNTLIDATNGAYVIGTNPATPTATDNDQQIKLTTGGATLGAGLIIGCRVMFTTD